MKSFIPFGTAVSRRSRPLLLALVTCALLAGCSGQQKTLPKGPFFFPPPPDEPRIQFLTGYSDSSDVEEKKGGFAIFLSGTEQPDIVRPIQKPAGIALYQGTIYVCDSGANTVYLIDPVKKRFEPIRGNAGSGKMKKPVNIAVDEQGRLYVTDVTRKEILVYSAQGDFIKALGHDVNMKPVAVAVDADNIYVLDFLSQEIRIFDRKTGTYLQSIGKRTPDVPGLAVPYSLALDAGGFLYVTNNGNGKVIKLDRDGHILNSFGKLGDGFGQFGRPKGIAVDREERIYVVDAAHQNVQMFTNTGRLLMFFGDPGLPRGSMNLPSAIALSEDNLAFYQQFADPSFVIERLIFVTNQFGDDKIAVYGYGHRKATSGPPAEQERAPGDKRNP